MFISFEGHNFYRHLFQGYGESIVNNVSKVMYAGELFHGMVVNFVLAL